MRWLRVLVVVGALIGSLVPTMAVAQEPATPKSEAIIEGEWKFTFTRQAVIGAVVRRPFLGRRSGPRPTRRRWRRSAARKAAHTISRCPVRVTHAPSPWHPTAPGPGAGSAGRACSRRVICGGCHQSGYDRTISSFSSMNVRVSNAIETSDGLVATNLEGEGTIADWVWYWWMDEGSTKNATYAQIARCDRGREASRSAESASDDHEYDLDHAGTDHDDTTEAPTTTTQPATTTSTVAPATTSTTVVAVVRPAGGVVARSIPLSGGGGRVRLPLPGCRFWLLRCGVPMRCRGRFRWWRPTLCWPWRWCC